MTTEAQLTKALEPKSDQLNADDLIGRTMDITIRQVKVTGGDQPISVYYEGDNGKPYKPCKSMGRVLKYVLGGEGDVWLGRTIRLFRDDSVTWAGIKVGGIRISHISGIARVVTLPLTKSKTVRTVYTVKPLVIEEKKPEEKAQPTESKTQQAPRIQLAGDKFIEFESEAGVLDWLDKNLSKVPTAEKLLEFQDRNGASFMRYFAKNEEHAKHYTKLINQRKSEL